MSASRTYVAECELCHTKFEADPGECPVCGGASMRAIREAVAAAEDIPVPTGRTKPPRALRKKTPPASLRSAAPSGRGPASPKAPAAPFAGFRPASPPRGPDGRFLPRKKAGAASRGRGGDGVARSAARTAPSAARGPTPAAKAAEALRRAAGGGAYRIGSSGGTTTIRIDVRDAAARLREARRAAADSGREYRRARAALREAREALSATRNRGTAIERTLRRIADWLEDLFV